jgi:hypothetical protein
MWIEMFLCSFYWLLRLTISNDPSSTNIRNKFRIQITMLIKIDLDRDMGNEYAKNVVESKIVDIEVCLVFRWCMERLFQIEGGIG